MVAPFFLPLKKKKNNNVAITTGLATAPKNLLPLVELPTTTPLPHIVGNKSAKNVSGLLYPPSRLKTLCHFGNPLQRFNNEGKVYSKNNNNDNNSNERQKTKSKRI